MKTKFIGYSKQPEEFYKELWKNATISFDANVLLNLYRYSKDTSDTILNFIKRFKERVWLTHQVALEFNRNRIHVIHEQEKAYNEFRSNSLLKTQEGLLKELSTKRHPFITTKLQGEFKKVFDNIEKELKTSEDKYKEMISNDKLYDELDKVFEKYIGDPYSKEELKKIIKEAKERFDDLIPPGYEDIKKSGDRKYGDYILWKQLLEFGKKTKKPIILISDDDKPDWWWFLNKGNKIGPRPELIIEMNDFAKVDFYMYTAENFIKHSSGFFKETVNDKAINEIKESKKEISDTEIKNISKMEEIRTVEKEIDKLKSMRLYNAIDLEVNKLKSSKGLIEIYKVMELEKASKNYEIKLLDLEAKLSALKNDL